MYRSVLCTLYVQVRTASEPVHTKYPVPVMRLTIPNEREIMIDVLLQVLLPEMSRAERACRAKKMNNSHCPALWWRRRGEVAPSGEAT